MSLNGAMLTNHAKFPDGPGHRVSVVSCVVCCLYLALGTTVSQALAQVAASTPKVTASVPRASSSGLTRPASPTKALSGPAWKDLKPAQQLSLKPLAANWSTMAEAEKRKWIAVAANYSKLTPSEQAKMHSHMTEWSSLSQQQRSQARLNFARSKPLTPTQKTETWQAYQALSPEQKKALVSTAPAKPKGGAIATKPVPPQKQVKIPLSRKPLKPLASASAAVDRNTLLPHSPTQIEPAQVKTN